MRVEYRGREALGRRLAAVSQDEARRKSTLEDEIKGWLPGGAKLTLLRSSGWDTTDTPLVAELSIELNQLASQAGARTLMPLGLFQAPWQGVFEHEHRSHPIYLESPFFNHDEITVELPPGMAVESLPAAVKLDRGFGGYDRSVTSEAGTVKLERRFQLGFHLAKAEAYPGIKQFYASVRSADDEHVVLRVADGR